jgi:hypothetical protein
MATTKVTTDVIDMSGNAGGLTWVKGTTAERPAGVLGELRENTETKRTEIYTDQTGTSEWRNLKESAVYDDSYETEYLVVAGGGGGGYAYGGGGGAGGYLTNFGSTKIVLATATAYTITVGAGGAGGIYSSSTLPTNGVNSVFSGGAGFTSSGGGTGGNNGADDATGGGSGGGASRNNPPGSSFPTPPSVSPGGANGTPSSQGNIGGEAYYPTPNSYGWFSGGGGGAGGAGENGKDTVYANGGAGGIGLQNNIDGNNYFYAGGGGGDGTRISSGAIAGGAGGSSIGGTGGHYSTSTELAPTDASPVNRGSGGGGGTNYDVPANAIGGAGSSGIIILRNKRATADVSSGVTVNGIAGTGTRSGVAIGSGEYVYTITLAGGADTITFN